MPSSLLTGLVSYWDMDEVAGARADSTGANNLTDVNAVGFAAGVVSNSAHFLQANSQALLHASNASLQIGNADKTFAGWVWFDSFIVSFGFPMAFAKTAGGIEYELFADGGNTLTWRVTNGGGQQVMVTHPIGVISSWMFFECWHDAANAQIGIRMNNGSPATAPTGGGGVPGTVGDFRVGARGNNSLFLDGRVDEFGIWDRLLTTAERAELYNDGAGTTYPFSEPPAPPTPVYPAELLSCECIKGVPQIDKLRNIYCAMWELAGTDPSLPTCICANAMTVNDLLDNIYCAARIWGNI